MRAVAILIVLLVARPAPGGDRASDDLSPAGLRAAFDEVHRTVAEHFLDPDIGGLDWEAIGVAYGRRADAARTLGQLGELINEMLALLGTSHTRFFTAREPAYYQLLSIFAPYLDEQIRAAHPENAELRYPGAGMLTARIDGAHFVRGVLPGWPAEASGLRVGDRVVAVDGHPFHPIGSFEGRVGAEVSVEIQRTPDPAGRVTLTLRPVMIDPAELFVRAMNGSIRIVERGQRRIGYVHAWSFAGAAYQELLEEALRFGPLREADALVLDIRDGWGGANPENLNLFNPRVPTMTQIARDGTRTVFDPQWRKPVALLVNGGSRSGKEVLAYGFRKHALGTVVGSRTAGAVVGGRPFLIGPGMLLYLAVMDVLIDGERLEGRGVEPDIDVPFELPYANGADPQLEAAIDAARRAVDG
jgi:carboxyl-terminal processing protease